jgi:DNA-binding transcriptional regulator GbsR (MarR family)
LSTTLENKTEYIKLSKRFANFKTIESLNTSIRQHLYNKKHELTPSAITVFKQLARYATKYTGVAFLKIATVMEITGFSRSTVIRALKLLQALGIVLKRHMMRPVSGGNGANMYVIQSYVPVEKTVKNVSDTPPVTPREGDETPENTGDSNTNSEPETLINLNPCNKELIRMQSAYERMKSIVFSYVKDKELLYKMYGVYLGQTKYLKDAYRESELIRASVYALRTTFSKVKTKNIRNIAGYFNGILSNTLDKLYEESISNMTFDVEEDEQIEDINDINVAPAGEVASNNEDLTETYMDIDALMAQWRAVPTPSNE